MLTLAGLSAATHPCRISGRPQLMSLGRKRSVPSCSSAPLSLPTLPLQTSLKQCLTREDILSPEKCTVGSLLVDPSTTSLYVLFTLVPSVCHLLTHTRLQNSPDFHSQGVVFVADLPSIDHKDPRDARDVMTAMLPKGSFDGGQ